MLNEAEFRELVSGRRRGPVAALVRSVLRAAEIPYRSAVEWRNRRYDRGAAKIHQVGVPVVSVGNLTLGGTGKTPLVKWLARWFTSRGRCLAVVSRGYRAAADGRNDEALELHQSLPEVPQVQNADRVAAALAAIERHGCGLVLLDDGFQHRRLARDLDIVLLDALEPFGFEHVFPRGTLREPLEGLRRAGVVCLSRADAIDQAARAAIRRRVADLAPLAVWCEVVHAPTGLINSAGASQPLDFIRGRKVAAFCGIGNPAGFRHTLAAAGSDVVVWREFADHHHYPTSDFDALRRLIELTPVEAVVCTQKDLVKLGGEKIANQEIWAVAIEINFAAGQGALEAALRNVENRIPQAANPNSESGS